MLIYLFIAVLTVIIVSIISTEKVICSSNKTAHFGTNELIFFESANYPKNMKNECEMNFILENYNNNIVNARIVFVLTNGKLPSFYLTANDVPVQLFENIAIINVTTYTEINAKIYLNDGYNAFQGMIASDDWNIRYPLESITNINPYIFTDETEIFYLFYPFGDPLSTMQAPKGRCIWKFLTPKKYYKFKFVVNTLLEDTSVELIYGNSQHAIINTPFDDFILSPNYLDGPVLEVIYNFPSYNLTLFVQAEFYVTIVKAFPFRSNAGCKKTTKEGKTVKWEITNGYANNAKCQLNLTLPIKNVYIATVTNFAIEDGIDQLRFHYDNKIINIVKEKSNEILQYTLQSNINGYNSYALWEFISDGSVGQQGFTVTFEEFECNCNTKMTILSCNETTNLQFMDPDSKLKNYCGNLHCSYTIDVNPKCPEKAIFITIDLHDFIDEYVITTNDGKVISSGKSNIADTEIGLFLSPIKFPLTLELISVPNIYYRGLFVTFDAVDPPLMFKKITLTKENPMYFFENDVLPSNFYAMIELDQTLVRF